MTTEQVAKKAVETIRRMSDAEKSELRKALDKPFKRVVKTDALLNFNP
jgi:hypothetical protein